MSHDLPSLSVNELESLARQVQDEILRKRAIARKNLLADLQKLARENGVDLNELVGEAKGKKTKSGKPKSTAPIKYCNPQDTSQTWTGRGRQPLWLTAALTSGKALRDFAV